MIFKTLINDEKSIREMCSRFRGYLKFSDFRDLNNISILMMDDLTGRRVMGQVMLTEETENKGSYFINLYADSPTWLREENIQKLYDSIISLIPIRLSAMVDTSNVNMGRVILRAFPELKPVGEFQTDDGRNVVLFTADLVP